MRGNQVGEVSTQGENRIFEENKKVMKFDFEKGKEQLLTWMDNEFDCSYGHSLKYIKELSTIGEIQKWVGGIDKERAQNALDEMINYLNSLKK